MKRVVLNITRSSSTSKPKKSFHKRQLPTTLTALSSSQGKIYFKEALSTNGMESYFPLAEQFVTQSEPSFCSLSSLSMVLNALNFDPKKIWKGLWRWVSEETLQCESTTVCGHSLERIKTDGLSFTDFEALARCHGVKITSHRVMKEDETVENDEHSNESIEHINNIEQSNEAFEEFRNLVEKISSNDQAETFIVTNFSRKILGQTGDGHFSPIGGYHKEKQLVLIMDVARFKYPPYWVPITQLWAAMAEPDKATNEPRGYFVVAGWNEKEPFPNLEEHIHSHNHSHHEHLYSNFPYFTGEPLFDALYAKETQSSSSVCTHEHSHSHDHSHDVCSISSSSNSSSSSNNNNSNSNTNTTVNTTTTSNTTTNTQINSPSNNISSTTTTSSISSNNVHIKAACPPMIRTWEDFKRYVPKNMCQTKLSRKDPNSTPQ